MNKFIIISIIFLILLVSLILIGVLGKHYVCVDNKCEYHYFTLNGLTSSECSSMCKKNELGLAKNENKEVTNNPRFYFAKVNVNDKYNVLCLPTAIDSSGRNVIPFTNELATPFNSYETRQECDNQKSFGNIYSVNDMYLLNSHYPHWRDYIYTNYNCGPQGCYYFGGKPWYWGPRRRWRRKPIRRRRKKRPKSFKISKN